MQTIETSILKSLLYNEEYADRAIARLKEEHFDGAHQTFFSAYKSIYDKYGKIPKLEAIAVTLSKFSIAENEYEQIINLVSEITETKNELPDTRWIVDETQDYCRDRELHEAFAKAFDIAEGKDKKLDVFSIPELFEDAVSWSMDDTIGMDFFEDAEKRYDVYTSEDARITFPIESLNRLSNGGHKKKCLSCILASINVGKSAIMCYLAGEFLKKGLNVLYISMEMAEEEIAQRIEANMLDLKTEQIEKLSKEEYLNRMQKIKAKTNGKLITKQYPTGGGHAGHFKRFIKEVQMKKKMKVDFVFVDYINICASSRYKSMNGVNSYSYIKAVAEELRGLAVEFDLPIMTATQFTRGAMNDKDPDMTSTSESIGLPQTVDFMFAAIVDEVLQNNNQIMFRLLKTRWGNRFKARPEISGVDYDKMRFFDVARSDETEEVKKVAGSKSKSRLDEIRNKQKTRIEWDD